MKKIFSLFSLIFLITAFALNAVNAAPRRCIVRKNKQNDSIKEPVNEALKEFKDCEITAWGCLNLTPPIINFGLEEDEEDEGIEEEGAYYVINLSTDKNTFLKKYKIEKIELNGKPIKDENISYKLDSEGFRFTSLNYKTDTKNVINIIIENNETNEKYFKKLDDVEVKILQ